MGVDFEGFHSREAEIAEGILGDDETRSNRTPACELSTKALESDVPEGLLIFLSTAGALAPSFSHVGIFNLDLPGTDDLL